MAIHRSSFAELPSIEDKLSDATNPADQIHYLELLIRQYVYVRPVRARELLQTLREKAEELSPGRLPFTYFLHLANLEAQEYESQKALPLLKKAVERVDRRGDIADKIEVYLDYVGVLVDSGRLDVARDYFDRASRLLDSYSSDRLRARSLVRQGYLYLNSFSYPEATPILLEAEQLFSSMEKELDLKDHYFYTLVQSGMGTLQIQSETLESAAAAFRRAIERCEEKGLKARLPWHRLNLSTALVGMEKYAEAISNVQSIIDTKANGSRLALAAAYVNLGMCFYYTDEPAEKVTPLLDQAEELYLAEATPNRQKIVSIEIARAQLSFDAENYETSIGKLLQTLDDMDSEANQSNLEMMGHAVEIYQMLARNYERQQDFEMAYGHQLNYDYYLEIYNYLQRNKRTEEFATKFEAARWEKERESLQLRASQLQLRALRAQMNPHFLYNALNSIQSFISTNEASTASKYLAKFAMLMRRSLEYTNREYITLEDEVQFLTDYLEINCHLRFEGQLTYSVKIDDELEEDIIGVPTMILQPYVENAIEHGLRTRPKGHIKVHFSGIEGDDDSIMAIVSDDGIGRQRVAEMQANDPTRPYHQSRGTSITQSRLELLTNDPENRVVIDDLVAADGSPAGTSVTIKIPVADVLPRRGKGAP